jgi:hypothetical protein
VLVEKGLQFFQLLIVVVGNVHIDFDIKIALFGRILQRHSLAFQNCDRTGLGDVFLTDLD